MCGLIKIDIDSIYFCDIDYDASIQRGCCFFGGPLIVSNIRIQSGPSERPPPKTEIRLFRPSQSLYRPARSTSSRDSPCYQLMFTNFFNLNPLSLLLFCCWWLFSETKTRLGQSRFAYQLIRFQIAIISLGICHFITTLRSVIRRLSCGVVCLVVWMYEAALIST